MSHPEIPPSPLRDKVGYFHHVRFRGYVPVHFRSGLQPPCPRFAVAVAGHHARLGTRLLARLCRDRHLRRLNSMRFQGATPTTPDVRITYPAFPDFWANCPSELRFVHRIACRPIDTHGHLRSFRPLRSNRRPSVARGFCPVRAESTRDCPLMSGSALHCSGYEPLLWRLLTPAIPSRHLTMPVAQGRLTGLPG